MHTVFTFFIDVLAESWQLLQDASLYILFGLFVFFKNFLAPRRFEWNSG